MRPLSSIFFAYIHTRNLIPRLQIGFFIFRLHIQVGFISISHTSYPASHFCWIPFCRKNVILYSAKNRLKPQSPKSNWLSVKFFFFSFFFFFTFSLPKPHDRTTSGEETVKNWMIESNRGQKRGCNDDDEMPVMMNDCISRPSFVDDDQYIRARLYGAVSFGSARYHWWSPRWFAFLSFPFFSFFLFTPHREKGGKGGGERGKLSIWSRRTTHTMVRLSPKGVGTEVALYVKSRVELYSITKPRPSIRQCWPDVNIKPREQLFLVDLQWRWQWPGAGD